MRLLATSFLLISTHLFSSLNITQIVTVKTVTLYFTVKLHVMSVNFFYCI